MESADLWKTLAKAILLPPTAPLIVAVVGLLLLRRRQRLGRALAVLGVGSLLLLCMPAIAQLLTRLVDDTPALELGDARAAQGIVILGGGIRRDAPEYGGDTLGRLTLERVRYGAFVARATRLPVLVSGGRQERDDATEAGLMKAALQSEYGIPVRWSEERSRNTHENARFSAALLRAEGVTRVVLVAHGFDMPRATAEFAAAGIATIPAPTGIPRRGSPLELHDFLPSAAALQASYFALYEIYAEAWRRTTTAVPALAPSSPSGEAR
jgi:uncharacterized SAM-binding protein YcdF (DUF218 family)